MGLVILFIASVASYGGQISLVALLMGAIVMVLLVVSDIVFVATITAVGPV